MILHRANECHGVFFGYEFEFCNVMMMRVEILRLLWHTENLFSVDSSRGQGRVQCESLVCCVCVVV